MSESETQVETGTSGARAASSLLYRTGGVERRLAIDGPVLVGSSEGAICRLVDPLVSRVHAEIAPRADGIWVRDLGSTNGTYVNDLRVECARLPPRATIRIGGTRIALVTESETRLPAEPWPHAHYHRLIGPSRTMRALFASIERVARTASSVLVQGETGTGKELVAAAVHDASPRASGPFVTLDCAALPETLLESELFGHAKGAFTGAVQARGGVFEAAHGGTIFLDEIGELPMALQPKLLRVLESRTVRRLGETSGRPVDVRIVSATHRDLLTMVTRGELREDLYFRLAVLPLTLPALRERREDVAPLFERFAGGPMSAEVARELATWPWPGNVRELRNFAERVAALGAEGALALLRHPSTSQRPPPDDVPLEETGDLFDRDYHTFRERWIERGEAAYVRRLVERSAGVSAAARTAGIARTYLHRLMKKHRI